MIEESIINPAGMHMNVKPLPSAAKIAVPIQMQTCRAINPAPNYMKLK